MAASAKDNLMHSLMGNPNDDDEDLFGSVNASPTIQPSTVVGTPAPSTPSRLAASGLLGGADARSTTGESGLFDSIDQEEEQQEAARKQQEEAARLQQEEAARLQQEEAARLQQAEEAARKQQEQAERQMQEQMQSIHLGGSTMQPPPGQYQNSPFPMNNGYAPANMQQPSGLQQSNMQHSNMQHSSMQQPNTQKSNMQQPNIQQPNMQPHIQQPNVQQSNMQQSNMQQSNMQQSNMQQSNMQQSNMQQPTMQQSNIMSPQMLMSQQQPMMMQSQPNMMQPNMMQQSHMQPSHQSMMQSPNGRFYQSPQRGSTTAGMHSATPSVYGGTVPPYILQPTALYDKIIISEPLLLNGSTNFLGIGQPPHWSYQITTTLQDATVWAVRRRFRHVVALEDRLRENCPGAILPPRPDKHATRAIEEASAHQSAEFAVQRAAELQVYLNQLVQHPIASASVILRLFLALQDDLGTAWPECSSNALTRLANASVGAAVKVSESTANLQSDASEDNAELLALQNAESSRIGAVLQAVPKLEGAVTLMREHAEESLAVGMEFSRVAKEAAEAQPMDIASAGLLRSGRRSKRLGLELSAALQSFSHQYKLCRYERMAFADRRAAIARRHKERHRADQRASHMMHNHHQFGLAQSAAMMDDMANESGQECEEIGQRLKMEVHRVAQMRRAEWSASVKIVASAMKEALTERVAIWESVQENFYQSYPEFKPPANGTSDAPSVQQG